MTHTHASGRRLTNDVYCPVVCLRSASTRVLSPFLSLVVSLPPTCAQWWGFYLELPEQLKFVEAFSVKVKERLAAPRGLNQVRGGDAMSGKLGSADYHPLCHCKVAKQYLHTFGVPLHTVLIGQDVSGGNWNGMMPHTHTNGHQNKVHNAEMTVDVVSGTAVMVVQIANIAVDTGLVPFLS